MLQRIQSVYLLLASACMLAATVAPLFFFLHGGERVAFEAMGLYKSGQLMSSTWGLFVIGLIGTVSALLTVFLYKKRVLQMRISVFNTVVMLCFYGYLAFLFSGIAPESGLVFDKIGIGIIMPLIAMILTYLAIRNIAADEALVRSLNRLRK